MAKPFGHPEELSGATRFIGGPEHPSDTTPHVLGVTPNSSRAAGGQAITITGTQFRASGIGPPTVLINGVAATNVVVVDQNTITCTTPASAGVGVVDLSVTCDGQTGTLVGGFAYFQTAITNPVSASALEPNFGPVAGGTHVIITGANFIEGSMISFGGIDATQVTFIDDQHYACVVPAGLAPGFVDVVITEPA